MVAPGGSVPLSGPQYTIAAHGYRATIAGVGGTLRELTFEERNLVIPFDADEVRPAYRGAVLAPWPNRIVDGTYSFDSHRYELALSEPERSHALHGLACWVEWEPVEVRPDVVVLGYTLVPQPGYPFRLQLQVRYEVGERGLSWRVSAVNTGTARAPYGTAPHPYLVADDGSVDGWSVTIPAEQVLAVTADRLIPTGLEQVGSYDDGAFDFRHGRPVGATFIDHAFTGLAFDVDGSVHVDVIGASGAGVRMTWDRQSPWVQIHTPQSPHGWRNSLAVEPMTCPPDAFNSGTDLVVLEPGEEHSVNWLISAL